MNQAFVERLTLTEKRIEGMASGLLEVAGLDDPVGETLEKWRRPNGLFIEKRRVPIGVIAIIYESRPNVTVDAAALCLKSGNAVVLRGGSDAIESNRALCAILEEAAKAAGLPDGSVSLVDGYLPRGGVGTHEAERADRRADPPRRQGADPLGGG